MKIARFYRIGSVLLQYGLDEMIPKRFRPRYFRFLRHLIFWLPNKYKDERIGKRLRLALQTLGPVYIKFGQMLSTRRDLFSDEIADELSLLQDKVPPFDPKKAKTLIEDSLGLSSIDELFSEFELTPLASASVAQVHAAKFRETGEEVVIKVLRPNIRRIIEADVDLIAGFAELVQRWLPQGRRLKPVEVVKEYKRTTLDELDLLREAANGIQIKRNFDGSDALYIPNFYSDYCRRNVIVMERIYGIPVSDIKALKEQGTNFKVLAERGVEVFFTQVFRDSFFHADMHPGNIFVSREHPENPKYIGIDYGIVGTLDKDDKRYLAENFIAFFNRDYRKVAELHVDSGWVPVDTNIAEFEMGIRTVCEPIFQKPLDQISFGNVLLQLFNTARRFDMEVQPQLVLLQKTLLYVEGLGRQLYPQLDLWKTAKPFLEEWMKQQIGPQALANNLKDNLPYWSEKLPEIPDLIYDTVRRVRSIPSQLEQQHKEAMKQNARLLRARFVGHMAVAFTIGALSAHLLGQHDYYAVISGLLAISCWIYVFRKSR